MITSCVDSSAQHRQIRQNEREMKNEFSKRRTTHCFLKESALLGSGGDCFVSRFVWHPLAPLHATLLLGAVHKYRYSLEKIFVRLGVRRVFCPCSSRPFEKYRSLTLSEHCTNMQLMIYPEWKSTPTIQPWQG